MARGAEQQQNLLNTQAGTQFNNAQSAYGAASTGFNSIINNPGYTPQQIQQQTVAAQTPIAGQAATAQNQLKQRAAATGNTAGMVAGQDAAARTSGQQQSDAALGVQTNAANVALQQRMQAFQGQSGLYGTASGSAGNLYGNATQSMIARPSVLQDIGQTVGIAGNLLSLGKGVKSF